MEYKVIKNRPLHCIYVFISAVICASGIFDGAGGNPSFWMYFTYLSNLLILFVFVFEFVLEAINIFKKTAYEILPGLKGLAVLSILFTFLTVFFVLSPFSAPSSWLDARIHYVVPLLAILDWIFFDTHCRYKIYYPLCWLFSPVVYFAYVLLLVICGLKFKGDYFPYFFMDVFEYGWGFVLPMILMLAGVFLVFGSIITFCDNIPMLRRKKIVNIYGFANIVFLGKIILSKL